MTNAVALLTVATPWCWHGAAGRGLRPPRIGNLGGFNPRRRPELFLQHTAEGAVVSFDQSASPLVLPREIWARDPDYDLIRAGLLSRDQIPLPEG